MAVLFFVGPKQHQRDELVDASACSILLAVENPMGMPKALNYQRVNPMNNSMKSH